MSTKTQTLAKSLHTVTALVRIAGLMRTIHPNATVEGAVGLAVIELGYAGAADPYGLAAKAVATINANEGRA